MSTTWQVIAPFYNIGQIIWILILQEPAELEQLRIFPLKKLADKTDDGIRENNIVQ